MYLNFETINFIAEFNSISSCMQVSGIFCDSKRILGRKKEIILRTSNFDCSMFYSQLHEEPIAFKESLFWQIYKLIEGISSTLFQIFGHILDPCRQSSIHFAPTAYSMLSMYFLSR